jgi:hypothetical protein
VFSTIEQPIKKRVVNAANEKSLCIAALYATLTAVAQADRWRQNQF